MGITEVPRSFRYECDACGAEHVQENAGGHYTDSRPPGWVRIAVHANSDRAMAPGPSVNLLCPPCAAIVTAQIDAALDRRRNWKSPDEATRV